MSNRLSDTFSALKEEKENPPRRNRTVLLEAQNLVHGDRNKTYGDPSEDMGRTAGMWTSLFKNKLKDGEKFEPRDISLAMICVKLSRLIHSKKRDSWTDCAGYAETGSWIDEG